MLDVTLHGDHFKISRQIDDFTRERFSALDRYLHDARSVNVTIGHEGQRYRVSAELRQEHLEPIHAHVTEDTVYEAIKHCSELVRKQLRRRHNRLADHHDG